MFTGTLQGYAFCTEAWQTVFMYRKNLTGHTGASKGYIWGRGAGVSDFLTYCINAPRRIVTKSRYPFLYTQWVGQNTWVVRRSTPPRSAFPARQLRSASASSRRMAASRCGHPDSFCVATLSHALRQASSHRQRGAVLSYW